jgi:hypothetical protein
VRLHNAAPPGLPAYVRLRADVGGPPGNPRAQNKLWVSIYTGLGSGFVSARIDGRPMSLSSQLEQGHPVVSTYLALDAGRTRTLTVRFWEPVAGPALALRPQPGVAPEHVTVHGIAVEPPWVR